MRLKDQFGFLNHFFKSFSDIILSNLSQKRKTK